MRGARGHLEEGSGGFRPAERLSPVRVPGRHGRRRHAGAPPQRAQVEGGGAHAFREMSTTPAGSGGWSSGSSTSQSLPTSCQV